MWQPRNVQGSYITTVIFGTNGVPYETVVANGEPKYTNGFSNGTVNAETLQSCRVEIADSTVAEIANW